MIGNVGTPRHARCIPWRKTCHISFVLPLHVQDQASLSNAVSLFSAIFLLFKKRFALLRRKDIMPHSTFMFSRGHCLQKTHRFASHSSQHISRTRNLTLTQWFTFAVLSEIIPGLYVLSSVDKANSLQCPYPYCPHTVTVCPCSAFLAERFRFRYRAQGSYWRFDLPSVRGEYHENLSSRPLCLTLGKLLEIFAPSKTVQDV